MSSLRLTVIVVSCLVLISVTPMSSQNVTTWHNDNFRTGAQLAETILTPAAVGNPGHFGLVFQYAVAGQTYAQPLAVSHVGAANCPSPTPCDMVFVATERDMLYGFDARSSLQIWSTNLADKAITGGSFDDCTLWPPGSKCNNNGFTIYPYFGVTGTPVIDPNAGILYVVSLVVAPTGQYPDNRHFFLHAIDIKTGDEKPGSPIQIDATYFGHPAGLCSTSLDQPIPIQFDATHQLQRAGLLLLSLNNGLPVIYVAFTSFLDATHNGWILGYTYNALTPGFAKVATFNTTPFGTGGGVWESGAGMASDGSAIYVPTSNGTFDIAGVQNTSTDYGDSLIRLNVNGATGALTVADYFTPYDVLTYQGQRGNGLCPNDKDFGSGGVMLFPEPFYAGHDHLLVSGDKQSRLFVVDRDNLGQFNAGDTNGENIVQQTILPPNPKPEQAYFSAPAYWKYFNNGQTYHFLYYSAEARNDQSPLPINMYALHTGPTPQKPLPSQPDHITTTKFCVHGTTPSISANLTTGGILWAIERGNKDSALGDCLSGNGNANWDTPAILHAYDATNIANPPLYSSGSGVKGLATKFSTPTIFNGRVYMGTLGQLADNGDAGEVDVFGLQ